MVRQGDIIFLDFNPTKGHEQKGERPAVIVSNNLFNRFNAMTLVCPITSSNPKTSCQVPLDHRTRTQGSILCDQARMIDLESRHYRVLESLPSDILDEVIDIFIGIVEK